MTRVAYVCTDPGVPVFGHKGCSVHVREMCRTMRESGHEVTLLAARRGGEPPAALSGMPVVDLPLPSPADQEKRESAAIAANEDVMRALAAAGPFDLIYERASLWSVAPMMYAERTSTVGILELNAPLVDEQARHRMLVQATVARALLSSSVRSARVVVAVSDRVAEWATSLAGADINVHVVPNGVDPRRFTGPVARTGERFVIGFVGTLKPWHGLATLVDAFARIAPTLPDVHLLIIGDGPERLAIEADLAARGLANRSTLTGAVPHDAIASLLQGMHVAVAPYPRLDDFYFSPLKLTEYMAAGLPIVASAIGQVTTLIRHEQTGMLFTPGDAGSLADALRRLYADAPLRERLGHLARTFAARHCTWRSVLDRILLLADAVAPQRASPMALVRAPTAEAGSGCSVGGRR